MPPKLRSITLVVCFLWLTAIPDRLAAQYDSTMEKDYPVETDESQENEVPDINDLHHNCSKTSCTLFFKEYEGTDEVFDIYYKFRQAESIAVDSKQSSNILRDFQKAKLGLDENYRSVWSFDIPDHLNHNTQCDIVVYASNEAGRSNESTFTFLTSAAEAIDKDLVAPGAVRNLKSNNGPHSIEVFWDSTITGQVETYEIRWTLNGEKIRTVRTKETTFLINDLHPGTKYNITVSVKNENMDEYGKPSMIQEETRLDTISVPNVSVTTTQSISTTERQSEVPEPKRNVTKILYEICINFACRPAYGDDTIRFLNLTPPAIEEDAEVLQTPGVASTIKMPSVKNPPAYQYVVLTDPGNTKANNGDVKNESFEILIEHLTHQNQTKEDDEEENKKSNHHNSGWVAGEIYVTDNTTHEFPVGKGDGNNRPLEDQDYNAVVVTEKREGNYSTFVVSDPITIQGEAIASGLSGILFGVLIFLILTCLFAWSYKKKQNKEVVRIPPENEDSYIPGLGRSNPKPTDANPGSPEVTYHQETEDVFIPLVTKDVNEVNEGQARLAKKIPLVEIEDYLSRVINTKELEDEFNSIPVSVEKKISHGQHPENRLKNCDLSSLPYDETRVKLPRLPNEPFSDYINASYIEGHQGKPNAYIAAEGPKVTTKGTVDDFWRMVWHAESQVIVTMASLDNEEKVVAQYWPEQEEVITKRGIEISLSSTHEQGDSFIRILSVKKEDEVREIVQYQHTRWLDDDGPPLSLSELAQTLCLIRTNSSQTTAPIIVHCRNGNGRTGTVLLVMSILDQIKTSGFMEAQGALRTLREGRAKIVENATQYNFAHKLLQEIVCREHKIFLQNESA